MAHYEEHHRETFADSALVVNHGIEQPPVVNPKFHRRQRAQYTVDEFVDGILSRNMAILSQAITMVESSREEHQLIAQQIIERCLPYTRNSIRIGITGVPGAGKSTFIEAIGTKVTALGHRLAVLAIDPSSERSKGSILGDKTRMETLVHNPDAFIRPSPSAGSLGGVARKTRESVVLCEAAGYDVIFIETVGVGQSETAVHSMVDLFLLLQISGAGDELQGIKRGIMEMADLIAITKADGANLQKAELAKAQISNALTLFPMPASGWKPRVYTTSSTEGAGLMELWLGIEDFLKHTKVNGYFYSNRARQSKWWMYETVNASLRDSFYNSPVIEPLLAHYEEQILGEEISSFVAASRLLETYFGSR